MITWMGIDYAKYEMEALRALIEAGDIAPQTSLQATVGVGNPPWWTKIFPLLPAHDEVTVNLTLRVPEDLNHITVTGRISSGPSPEVQGSPAKPSSQR